MHKVFSKIVKQDRGELQLTNSQPSSQSPPVPQKPLRSLRSLRSCSNIGDKISAASPRVIKTLRTTRLPQPLFDQ